MTYGFHKPPPMALPQAHVIKMAANSGQQPKNKAANSGDKNSKTIALHVPSKNTFAQGKDKGKQVSKESQASTVMNGSSKRGQLS